MTKAQKGTAEWWMGELGLDELPDPETLTMLNVAHHHELEHGSELPAKVSGASSLSPKQIGEQVQEAVWEKSLSDLLHSARTSSDASLAQLAEAMGVSKGRVQQLEKSENVEVMTLVRYLNSLGYSLVLTAIPDDPAKPPVGAVFRPPHS